jgi:4-hydroxy-3-methylbut-2-enyl diphosphate reductase
MGQLPPGAVRLIETAQDAESFEAREPSKLAYITQTTLSVDDTAEIVNLLRRRFPEIAGPHKEDICYATTNRQEAVKAIAPRSDVVLVIGAPNSSNSMRLVEVASRAGVKRSSLVQRASDIDWSMIGDARVVGLTAGASAPDVLIQEVIDAFRSRYDVTVEETETARETVQFRLPRALLNN